MEAAPAASSPDPASSLESAVGPYRRPPEITALRLLVREDLLRRSEHIREPSFRSISSADVAHLCEQYDLRVFDGRFAGLGPDRIRYRVSDRATASLAGKCERLGKPGSFTYRISVNADPLFRNFQEGFPEVTVCGLPCRDRIDALLLTVEHELVHLFEMISHGDSDCSADRFRGLARDIFGHTETRHEMLTPAQAAEISDGLRIGDRVAFDFQGRRLDGVLTNIIRRAVVMVEDSGGAYSDQEDHRFAKYYVPLQDLRRVES